MTSADTRLHDLLSPVEGAMQQVRQELQGLLVGESPALADMLEHLTRFQGKRLRAALLLLSGQAVGNTNPELPAVAGVVEAIHLATLVHDDVLDGADVRRRVASVNRRWDNQSAVLLGDLLYSRAFDRSTRLKSRMASQVLSQTTQIICEGEIVQAASRYEFEMSQAAYEGIAGAKTAALYRAACELGARYPGGAGEGGELMAGFGWRVGLAFQIIDDVLDVIGDQEVVGKSVGNDVEDGKVTLPVLVVYGGAGEASREAIRDAYTRPEWAGLRASKLREVCDLAPGVEHALGRAGELVSEAMERLVTLPDSAARRTLEQLGDYVLERKW
jgi:octaprenyl-diphosphate synthase